jgi:uncharacterized protein YdgA (DUF945 family)
MKKAVSIVAGVVVVVGALATAGAWYTGTQLEGVLNTGVANANQQFDTNMVGPDGKAVMHLELISLERHLFSSTAHYRLQVHGEGLGDDGQPVDLLFVDHIEHGPLPASRLKTLNLLPVMATSNLALEPNPATAQWFAVSKDPVPLSAHISIHYGGDSAGTLNFAPLEMKSDRGSFTFSGLKADVSAGANADSYALSGLATDLVVDGKDEHGQPVHMQVKDLSFNLGGTRGQSGFYLGHNDAKVGRVTVNLPGVLPFELRGISTTSLAQEAQGLLSGEMGSNVDSISLGGKPLGQLRSLFKFGQFDAVASKSLYQLFQTKIAPQQQAAAAAGIPFKLQLDQADQQAMQGDITKLLAAKPHIELQDLSLKTSNGEGHISLAIDLAPVPLSGTAVAPTFGANLLGAVDAKVSLSKAMLNDLGVAQANIQGITDPAAIAQNGKNVSDMVSGMAVMMQLGKVEGDNVTSQLHYEGGMVDFNGQRMTGPQFLATVLGRFGLGQR